MDISLINPYQKELDILNKENSVLKDIIVTLIVEGDCPSACPHKGLFVRCPALDNTEYDPEACVKTVWPKLFKYQGTIPHEKYLG